ncbi:MAG: efflux transporter outer membrane subunit [Betaproteobacteria bacterium]|nr:MAG: efflux transporter outer membrane subunit [Betaproteobacteria bacterium]
MKPGAIACLVLLGALPGCAVGPDYKRPQVQITSAYKEAGEWKPAQPQDDLDRGKWWGVFGDPQLDVFLQQVEISNQNVLVADAQFRRAQALVASSRAAYFPTLDAGVSVVRSRSPTGVIGGTTAGRIITNRSASLNSGWEADLWGRLRRTVESSEAGAQASAADLAAARLSAQAEVASDYFQLRILDAQRQLLEDTVAGYQKSLDLTRNRYDAGVAAKVDLVQAETQLKSTQAEAIDTGVQRAQLEHAIAVLIGKAPAEFSIAAAPLAAAMPRVPMGLPSELLERRPDVAAAERRVAAANAQIGVAKAAYFPSLILSASYGSRSADASQWFTVPSRFWSIGPALAQSIFDAGLRRAQTEQAIAAYDATVAEYRQAVLAGFQEVEDNLAALRILGEEAEVQEGAVRAARESVLLTTNQYKAGIVSYINVVTVQTTQLNNERTAVGILGRRLVAAVILVKALGGGWGAAEIAADNR